MRDYGKLGKYLRVSYGGGNKKLFWEWSFLVSLRKVKEIIVVGVDLVSDGRYVVKVELVL